MGFMAAMKQYFGLLPGQTPMEFGREVIRLSDQERLEFHAMLLGQGIVCDPPQKAAEKK